jgi:hypothetical protein
METEGLVMMWIFKAITLLFIYPLIHRMRQELLLAVVVIQGIVAVSNTVLIIMISLIGGSNGI